MGILPPCVNLCCLHGCWLGSEEKVSYPGTEVIDYCNPSFGYWEVKPGFLEEQVLFPGKLLLQSLIHGVLTPTKAYCHMTVTDKAVTSEVL